MTTSASIGVIYSAPGPDLLAGFEGVGRGKEKEEGKENEREGKRKGRDGKRKGRKEKGKRRGKGKGEMVPHFLVQNDAKVSQ